MAEELTATLSAESVPLTPEDRSSLRREVLRLAWPVVLQNMFRTVIFLTDTYMIGRVSDLAQSSMALVGPVVFTVTSILAALGVGTIATVARATGEGDSRKMESEAATSLLLALGMGIVATVLGVFLLPRFLGLFEVPGSPEVVGKAKPFAVVLALAFPFMLLEVSASNILRAAGDSRTPMLLALLANAINLFLNWVLIFGNLGMPRLEILGAGIATATAFTVQGILTTGFLFTRRSKIRLRGSSFRAITRESSSRLLRVTCPAVVEPVVLQSGFMTYVKIITLLGPAALAAHRAAVTVESISFMPAYGMSIACAALVGQYLGARRSDKADASFRISARYATWFMSALGAVYVLFPVFLIGLFIQDSITILVGAMCLGIVAFEQPFMALAMVLGGALRGAGDTKSPVAVAAVGVWGVRVPLAYVLAIPCKLGLYGIWITMIADWAVRTLLFGIIYRRGKWKAVQL